MSEYEIKERILDRLHQRLGRCGHCGKRDCAGRSSHSVLPLEMDLDDVMWAISLDQRFEPAPV